MTMFLPLCSWVGHRQALGQFGTESNTLPGTGGGSAATFSELMRQVERNDMERMADASREQQSRMELLGVLHPETTDSIKEEYETAFVEFKNAIGRVWEVYLRHQVAIDAVGDKERLTQFSDAMQEAHRKMSEWREVMARAFESSPSLQPNLALFMEEMLYLDSTSDRFEGLLDIARSLMMNSPGLAPELLKGVGYTAYALNDYELAELAWSKLEAVGGLDNEVAFLLSTMDEQKEKWIRELGFREVDRVSDNNPRVLFKTSKGNLSLELFEDQAPEAVASFVYLVEQGFYNRKSLFRVIQHFCVQTGCERSDGTGNAGYAIAGEMGRDDARDIFRGSLVLLTGINEETGELNPDSGSSQFFFAMMPQPMLDRKMTVFGRVVEGEHVLGTFNKVDLTDEAQKKNRTVNPDLIYETEVLRKRERLYRPKPVIGRLP